MKTERGKIRSGYHQNLPKKSDTPISFVYEKEQLSENDVLQIPLWHEELEIKFFLKGGAEINCGSDCFLTKENDFVIINPYEYHNTDIFKEGDNPVYHLMMLNLNHPSVYSVFQENMEKFEKDTIPFFINHINNTDLPAVKLFLLLAEDYKNNGDEFTPYKENLLRAFLYSLIMDCVNPDHPENYKSLNAATADLVPALQYIDNHYSENISLATLSSLCRFSTSRFSHVFKEVTGTSAIKYINDLRMSKATMLLNTSNLSISEIAVKVGFYDAAYFSRIYKLNCGISPSDYRKTHKLN